MHCSLAARKVANFIQEKRIECYQQFQSREHDHIGALYTNIILQAGLNYKTIVAPRVRRVYEEYPNARTISGLVDIINDVGISSLIQWKDSVKIERLLRLVEFSSTNRVEDCNDLRKFLVSDQNKLSLLSINGIGHKTLDYALRLLDFDNVAVDRHITSFVVLAGVEPVDYFFTKRTVEYAADLLMVPRRSVDQAIWNYMSQKIRD